MGYLCEVIRRDPVRYNQYFREQLFVGPCRSLIDNRDNLPYNTSAFSDRSEFGDVSRDTAFALFLVEAGYCSEAIFSGSRAQFVKTVEVLS
jgi:hypothetical protein